MAGSYHLEGGWATSERTAGFDCVIEFNVFFACSGGCETGGAREEVDECEECVHGGDDSRAEAEV